jgi:hypothetical protein
MALTKQEQSELPMVNRRLQDTTVTSGVGVLAGRCGGFRLSRGLPAAERADEPACLGAVEHDGRGGLAVPEGAEPNERGLSSNAYVRAVLVRVED